VEGVGGRQPYLPMAHNMTEDRGVSSKVPIKSQKPGIFTSIGWWSQMTFTPVDNWVWIFTKDTPICKMHMPNKSKMFFKNLENN